ncbi:hypothetical protein MM300_19865 [Evansella sp. LMS18]|jgi:hypothetical protein|uniref:hypothetical protein n=1 Tax=Evansella sp. LMS18 TaxID=2924033 RepID=UPI0020D1D42F|nr:hypothetical protein [Evansella sp. LMS18]UTR10108.1 hypothetical protein MM300_19865 [Evansella sp. LMS18]
MNFQVFLITFILVYILLSLPAILGIGYVIEWVPEATITQKLKEYVADGLLNNFILKTINSCIVGIVVSMVFTRKRQKYSIKDL